SENGTVADIKPAIERLQQASYKMAELLYQKTTPGADGAGTNGATQGDHAEADAQPSTPPEDVIDAEFKEAK
ncbi:MAG: molecular chaperone DnaK, partial [Candidatus Eremiobacteraeota bacterium]|nr:molecular chaperone DnaK [Candidatus Eremiobacteraeota bacterium]